ncbi:hypothetical protein SAMN05444339_10710 [Loktanella atrilutea]|uniref:Uncharacterized protein n=1 Tax=Loktanella atrilutea TaxID=366533 RepID=A0A1M5C538_LOKAT|nr:hypothetical protein [Loktanella atrilutea]SHF49717.1 hypothetical protein SAMN05444339_10710 [Loktanella atrilutea]
MQEEKLTQSIWKGACCVDRADDCNQLKLLIKTLVPVETSVFQIQGWSGHPSVMADDIECIPGITLGDVLAEELDACVPYGSLVIIRNENAFSDISHAVGTIVGEMLLHVVCRGVFPLAEEDSVLHTLGMAYCKAVQADAITQLGLDPAAFRAGLTAVLAKYWGHPADADDFFLDTPVANLCEQGREHSVVNKMAQSLAALMKFDSKLMLNQCTLRLKLLVNDGLDYVSQSTVRGNVGIS